MQRSSGLVAASVVGAALVITTAVAQVGFHQRTLYPAPGFPFRLIVAEVTGDAELDIVTANALGNDLSLLAGNGDGTLASAVSIPGGVSVVGVAAGDFDGLTGTDLVSSGAGAVYLNDGSGGFAASTLPAGSAFAPAAADLDDRNHDDILMIGALGEVTLLLNDGDGTFSEGGSFPATGGLGNPSPVSVRTGDLDGDGNPDVVLTYQSQDKVAVYRNDGDGNFTFVIDHSVGSAPFSTAIADVDGDGNTDVVTGNYNTDSEDESASLSVLWGAGDGTFPDRTDLPTPAIPLDVAAADLDGDQLPDVFASESGGSIGVHFNLGGRAFATRVPQDTGGFQGSYGVATGDFDGDQRIDLAACNYSTNTVAVLLQSDLPAPAITTLSPDRITESGAHTIVVDGTGFEPGLTVDLGVDIAIAGITIESSTRLLVHVTVSNALGSGTRSLMIENSDGQRTAATIAFDGIVVETTGGTIKDGARRRRDKAVVRGKITFTSLANPQHFNRLLSSLTFKVGDASDPLVIKIPANDPGWRPARKGGLIWKSPAKTKPKVKLKFDPATGVFALTATRFDFPAPVGETVRVEVETHVGTQPDNTGSSERVWQRRNRGKLKL